MAWCEGVEETRLLVALSDPSATGDDMGRLLSLHHPKSGDTTCYLLINGGLQELNWFKQSYGSWFLGDYICEGKIMNSDITRTVFHIKIIWWKSSLCDILDGGLYLATPVDPVFILLPMFDEARMKNGDDPGKFRQLDEIIYVHNYPGYHHLSSIAEKSMEVVCDCKAEIGSTKFFRLNDSKVVAWMYYKVQQLKQTLPKLDKNYAARTQKDIRTACISTLVKLDAALPTLHTCFGSSVVVGDAVMILGEYLKDEPWLKLLCNNLGLLNMDDDEAAADITETLLPTTHSSFNSNPIQEQTGGIEKRVTRSKKAKPKEMNSHSIKDMFSRASRR
ncbi:Ribonuclease H2, subunit B [Cynara cardunculus var. scolymus]|uniref:Ribonuclease H2, subunit B n=1 Tax=Cynara cardunculus var. scolymus TaxID=59895 RepID=A0A118JSB2_CYNCS|nr:Ribonuclease H2, subunit B [Cynara cardunculus var. scolymus]